MVHAVNGVSLEIRPGEIFGIIGETGSGKSVLGLSIPGLLPGNCEVGGSIVFKGTDLLRVDRKRLRHWRGSEIAFIPQNPATSLNPVLTIGYQVAEAIARFRKMQRRKAIAAQAAGLLRDLRMPAPEQKLKSYPFQLSGGMKQRVLAAIGLAGQPSLLIADEPTKGLDAIVRNQVVDMLHRMAQATGAAMLVITHDLHVAEALCDRVGVMYAGQLVEEGRAGDIFQAPKHPYTKGLLRSMPGRGMVPIPGTGPSLTEQAEGCAFYARCGERRPVCMSLRPALYASAGTPEQDGGVDPACAASGSDAAGSANAIDRTCAANEFNAAYVTKAADAMHAVKVRCFLYDSDSRSE
ncbi:putative D,D-dipeptide transport ATP-binding protein DdpD [Paenibacillus solanacearum]|uniref:Nickel import system ATP-binding protein NikD n=1 Tax=Paenibacillus solanacearum TaxID=2048548 RepID=A0A916NQR7_9BACL|nr:ABC transporter ATP-binding protein [Paenibacillus solanacearum]CAG7629622.1 putative D,D-dipeptide transport ATP-binding protein DdpD [Paenibacillus solanacearum]